MLEGAAGIVRTMRARQPRDYLSRTADKRVTERQSVAAADLPLEFMLNGLRLIEGFDEESFETRTGLPVTAIAAAVADAERRGLLEQDAPAQMARDRDRPALPQRSAGVIPAGSSVACPDE